MSLDDNTTTYDYQSNITTTDVITTEIISTNPLPTACAPNCFLTAAKPPEDVAFIIKLVTSIVIALTFVIIISIVVFLRHHQQSRKQQQKEKEYLQTGKLNAHPFEEIIIFDDDKSKPIELIELRPTTVTN